MLFLDSLWALGDPFPFLLFNSMLVELTLVSDPFETPFLSDTTDLGTEDARCSAPLTLLSVSVPLAAPPFGKLRCLLFLRRRLRLLEPSIEDTLSEMEHQMYNSE